MFSKKKMSVCYYRQVYTEDAKYGKFVKHYIELPNKIIPIKNSFKDYKEKTRLRIFNSNIINAFLVNKDVFCIHLYDEIIIINKNRINKINTPGVSCRMNLENIVYTIEENRKTKTINTYNINIFKNMKTYKCIDDILYTSICKVSQGKIACYNYNEEKIDIIDLEKNIKCKSIDLPYESVAYSKQMVRFSENNICIIANCEKYVAEIFKINVKNETHKVVKKIRYIEDIDDMDRFDDVFKINVIKNIIYIYDGYESLTCDLNSKNKDIVDISNKCVDHLNMNFSYIYDNNKKKCDKIFNEHLTGYIFEYPKDRLSPILRKINFNTRLKYFIDTI
jgi:hypothetical protein